jgi:Family of unknown function (DUF5947)
MSTPFDVLSRITARRPEPPAGERCEMCAETIAADRHQHVVNLTARQLMCVCRGCYLLFTDPAAELRYRAVPDRYLALPGLAVDRGSWDALQIPVGLAFFFRNSALGRFVAFYPGPAGACESELDIAAFDELTAGDPRAAGMADDVEALLVRVPGDGAPQSFLVPIDACYEFVGGLRMLWRGFDGGRQAHEYIDGFFTTVADRSRTATR